MGKKSALLMGLALSIAFLCFACMPVQEAEEETPSVDEQMAEVVLQEEITQSDAVREDFYAEKDIAAQTELIAAASAEWYRNEGDYFYTVTDLDHNGRLELIAAACTVRFSSPSGRTMRFAPLTCRSPATWSGSRCVRITQSRSSGRMPMAASCSWTAMPSGRTG